jgi:hypothetical protein
MIWRLAMAGVILLGTLTAASIFYRMHRAKPILRPEFSAPRFAESWCSGRSDRSSLARLAGARNILWVAVTKDTLHASPHFPFNLMFFAEAFGWDHRVPVRTIITVRALPESARVAIHYRHKTGDEELLELSVINASGLVRALDEARRE